MTFPFPEFPDCIMFAAPFEYPTVTTELEGSVLVLGPQKPGNVEYQSGSVVSWIACRWHPRKPRKDTGVSFQPQELGNDCLGQQGRSIGTDQSASRSVVVQVEDHLGLFQMVLPCAQGN